MQTQSDAAAAQALQGLADITSPPPVSWTPQTWGWAVLAAAVAIAVIVALWKWRRRSLANRYRAEALAELTQIERRARDPQQRAPALVQTAELIKRTALAAYPRDEVAALSGAAWVAFLRDRGPKVARPAIALFDDLEYRGEGALASTPDADVTAVIAAARHWIRSHRVPA